MKSQDPILKSERDKEIFFKAVFGDIKPNNKLKQAAKNYKKNVEAQRGAIVNPIKTSTL